MSQLRITRLEGDHAVEVLAIDGGREERVAILDEPNKDVLVEVAAPAAVVLRELPTAAQIGEPE